jgi:hypothetical protein
MSNELSELVKSATAALRQQLQERDNNLRRPYERDGSHVVVGLPKPLDPDFLPSGSMAEGQATAPADPQLPLMPVISSTPPAYLPKMTTR